MERSVLIGGIGQYRRGACGLVGPDGVVERREDAAGRAVSSVANPSAIRMPSILARSGGRQ